MPIPALVLEWLELKWRDASETRNDCARRIHQAPLTNSSNELIKEWETLRHDSHIKAEVLNDLLEKLKGLDS